MDADGPASDDAVLQSKRVSTIYQILVQIAERQPAVSQQEIADEVGVTPQAVSDYLQELAEEGYVETGGRGRYEITNEGVDWLISQTDALREFVDHVAEEVLEGLEVETVIAAEAVSEGDAVTLEMVDGILHAVPGGGEGATAVAVTDAAPGREVGVTNFEGVIEYEFGAVTIVSVPPVQEGGSTRLDADRIVDLAREHDILAVDGESGLGGARIAELTPDIRFGTHAGVRDAATRGLDVLVLADRKRVSRYTDGLRERAINYEVLDPLAEP